MMATNKLSQILKENKMRNTQARQCIYDLLSKSHFSLSPKEVFEKIGKKSNTDLVSVYRNLSLFEELGLVHRFHDGKYASCHHHEHDSEHSHNHIHFINHCTSCGKSSEIKSHSKDVCKLGRKLKDLSDLLIQLDEIVIQGLCSDCTSS